MQVLLLRTTNPDATSLADRLTSALTHAGVTVATAHEVNPDLDGYDLVHLIATRPIEHALRHSIHVRRWGRPLVVTPVDWSSPKPYDGLTVISA